MSIKTINQILKIHSEIDAFIQNEIDYATGRMKNVWSNRKSRNDAAWFMQLMATFEDRLVYDYKKLRDKRVGNRWPYKSLWAVLKDKNLNFKSKLSILIDNNGPDYQKILIYWKVRNDIAHTGMSNNLGAIDISVAANDLNETIQKFRK